MKVHMTFFDAKLNTKVSRSELHVSCWFRRHIHKCQFWSYLFFHHEPDGFTDFISNVIMPSLSNAGYCFVLPLIAAGTWWSFVQASGDKLPVEVCDQASSGIPGIYKINWVFGNYNAVVNEATLLQQYMKSIQFASKVYEFNKIYKNTTKLTMMGD